MPNPRITKLLAALVLLVLWTSTPVSEGQVVGLHPEGESAVSPSQELAALDGREPVPLMPMMALHQKEMMRDHLVVVQEVVGALATGDFEAVRKSASRIASSQRNEQMCSHMGAGAEGFTEMGLAFHEAANAIVEAADKEDLAATLGALNVTLGFCTACHSHYRQEVVSEGRWQELTQMAPPSHSH